jgi:hypothetical protein
VKIEHVKSLHLLKGDRFLTLAEESGVTVVDIDSSEIVNPTVGN